jgi:hypothetical protein
MKVVSVRGVLIGGVVDVITSMMLGIPFALYALFRIDVAHLPPNKIGSAMVEFTNGNVPLYLGQLSVGLACSVFGGYVAARLAKHDEIINGTLSAFLCVLLGIYTIFSGRDRHPLFVQIALVVASPVMGLLGGYLRLRQRTGRYPYSQE